MEPGDALKPGMTAESMIAALEQQGYVCVAVVVVHKTKPLGCVARVRYEYPEEYLRELLQSELDKTPVREVVELKIT
jgi:hypothetical protein